MTQITDILPRYTQLNAIVRNVVHRNKILFSEQQFVTDFYRQFADIQLFERMLIGLNGTNGYQVLFNSLKTEIESNISLIISDLDMLKRLDIERTCRGYANQYEAEIEVHTRAVNKKWKEYSYVNNLVDMIGYRAQSKEEVERLWEEHARLKEKHDAGQKKLQELYEKQKEAEKTALEYSENCFFKTLSISVDFFEILHKYIVEEKNNISETFNKSEIKATKATNHSTTKHQQVIEYNMIFKSNMYPKFLALEEKLKKDNYLNSDLYWLPTHKNNKSDIKRLVTFLLGLDEKDYFLADRNPMIRRFFENRYHVSIGQSFEKKRRAPLIGEYRFVFSSYSF